MYRISITARNEEVYADPDEAAKANAWVEKQAAASRKWAEGLDGVDEVEVDAEAAGYHLRAVGNQDVPDLPLEADGEAEDPEALQALVDDARGHVGGLEYVTEAHGEFGPLGYVDLTPGAEANAPGGAVTTASTHH